VECPKSSIQFEIFQNPGGSLSIQGGVKYRGPVRPQSALSQMQRIKIDITLDEPLMLPSVIRNVEHPYSDRPASGISILAYSYEELFAEKVRALAQRLRPRDLYDVIHLHRRMDLSPDQKAVLSVLEKKCVLRGITRPTVAERCKTDLVVPARIELATLRLGNFEPIENLQTKFNFKFLE